MSRTRIFSILVFAAALAVFGIYKYQEFKTTDQVGPRITMDQESITVSVNAGEEELLSGIQAVDKRDGDVSESLLIESMSNFIEKGRRKITVAAFDSGSHVTKASREIIYSDYQSPRFSLSAPLRFPIGTQDILSGMDVTDVLDGSLTDKIKISTDYSINTGTPGDYPMFFTVVNSAGDVVNLPVTVQIYDPAEERMKPQIELSEYLVYAAAGSPINPAAYVREITGEGASRENLLISQEIDYNTPGVYEVTYQVTGEGGTGMTRLIVVVSE